MSVTRGSPQQGQKGAFGSGFTCL